MFVFLLGISCHRNVCGKFNFCFTDCRKRMSSSHSPCTNFNKLCRICGNLLGKNALAKKMYITQLNSVLFINVTKDLQYIHPPKICMKCYLLMNTVSKRNSTISLNTYKSWMSRWWLFVPYVCKGNRIK